MNQPLHNFILFANFFLLFFFLTVICERLHQMQLIDDTYTIEEFQFMRSHYQKALYQLLAVAKSSTQAPSGRNILLPLPRLEK